MEWAARDCGCCWLLQVLADAALALLHSAHGVRRAPAGYMEAAPDRADVREAPIERSGAHIRGERPYGRLLVAPGADLYGSDHLLRRCEPGRARKHAFGP